MARLASAVKGGYYPMPESVTPLIAGHISSSHGGRILDPCAGKGIALATIATALGLEAYGVELNQARALNATDQIQALDGRQDLPLCDHHPTRFVQGDYRALVTSKGAYNLLYLNPPYDFDQDAGRLEYQWLRDCREWPGGAGYPARAAEDRPQAGLNEEQIASMVLCYNIFEYRIPEYGVD